MSDRAVRLQLIDEALAELSSIDGVLTAARERGIGDVQRGTLTRGFQVIAQAGAGRLEFAPVQELAALAGKVTDGTDASALRGDLEVVQHAADVLSLMLRDLGHQLLGRRGANVAPAAGALRERLEHVLLADSRR